jgi:hypothetical protein
VVKQGLPRVFSVRISDFSGGSDFFIFLPEHRTMFVCVSSTFEHSPSGVEQWYIGILYDIMDVYGRILNNI